MTRVVKCLQTRADFDVNMYVYRPAWSGVWQRVHLLCYGLHLSEESSEEFFRSVLEIEGLDVLRPVHPGSECTLLEDMTIGPVRHILRFMSSTRSLGVIPPWALTAVPFDLATFHGDMCGCSVLTSFIALDVHYDVPLNVDALINAYGVDSNGIDLDRVCGLCLQKVGRVQGLVEGQISRTFGGTERLLRTQRAGRIDGVLNTLRAVSARYHRELPVILRSLFHDSCPGLLQPMRIVFGYLDQTNLSPVALTPTRSPLASAINAAHAAAYATAAVSHF